MTRHHCTTGYHDEPSRTCYGRHGCRCEGCVDASRAYLARRSVTPVGHTSIDIPDELHQTLTAVAAQRGTDIIGLLTRAARDYTRLTRR